MSKWEKIVCFLAIVIVVILGTPDDRALGQGQPCQWNYSIVGGIATATYCGNVQSAGGITLTSVASIAAMEALPSPVANEAVITAGLQGNGSTFVFSTSPCNNAGAGDGGTQFPPAIITGCWLRQFSGAMHTLWFGADNTGATDTHVAIQACDTAAYNANTTYNVCYFDPGTYSLAAPIVRCASWDAADNNGTKVQPFVSSPPAYLIDMGGCAHGGWSKISHINFSLNNLTSATTSTVLGSSSSPGTGNAGIDFTLDVFQSPATGAYALDCAGTSGGQGYCTGSVFDGVRIFAPCPIRIGLNQNDMTFNSLREQQSGGCTLTATDSWGAEDVVLNSPYIFFSSPAAITDYNMVVGGNVLFNDLFIEGSTLANQAIEVVNAPIGFPTFNGLKTNLSNYAGSSADAAWFAFNQDTAAGGYSAVGLNLLNGYDSTGGVSGGYGTLLSIACSTSTATNNAVLNIQGAGWRLFASGSAHFAKARTGSTTNSNNVFLLEGGPDQNYGLFHSGCPSAGSFFTWTAFTNATWSN